MHQQPDNELDLMILQLRDEVLDEQVPKKRTTQDKEMIRECKRQYDKGLLSKEAYDEVMKTLE